MPALRGLTPPTTWAPDASIRVVCFMPSEPVMPWTMIFEFSVSQMAMSVSLSLPGRSQLGRARGGTVHRVDLLEQRQRSPR